MRDLSVLGSGVSESIRSTPIDVSYIRPNPSVPLVSVQIREASHRGAQSPTLVWPVQAQVAFRIPSTPPSRHGFGFAMRSNRLCFGLPHRQVPFPDDVCARPSWCLSKNWSLKTAELRPPRLFEAKASKRRSWNGLPPLFHVCEDCKEFQDFIRGLSATCGDHVPDAGKAGEPADPESASEDGGQAPEENQPPAQKRPKAAATVAKAGRSSQAKGAVAKSRPRRPQISMAAVRDKMKKMTT